MTGIRSHLYMAATAGCRRWGVMASRDLQPALGAPTRFGAGDGYVLRNTQLSWVEAAVLTRFSRLSEKPSNTLARLAPALSCPTQPLTPLASPARCKTFWYSWLTKSDAAETGIGIGEFG